jgi:hypothetical protein
VAGFEVELAVFEVDEGLAEVEEETGAEEMGAPCDLEYREMM